MVREKQKIPSLAEKSEGLKRGGEEFKDEKSCGMHKKVDRYDHAEDMKEDDIGGEWGRKRVYGPIVAKKQISTVLADEAPVLCLAFSLLHHMPCEVLLLDLPSLSSITCLVKFFFWTRNKEANRTLS